MKRFLVAIAVLFVFAACASACDDGPQSHVYVAMLYESVNACLDPSTTLAIIGTPDGSLNCAPTCLVENAPPAEGTEKVYVSTMCGPYPAIITDTSGTDPACVAALAAFSAGTVCGETTGDDSGALDSAPGDDGSKSDDSDASGDDAAPSANDAGDSGDLHDSNAE
jgi:hypothetical protein